VRVQVRLFALYRERTGESHLEMQLPDGADAGVAARELIGRYPQIGIDSSSLVVAVNQEYVPHDFSLVEGDEVAFIPPVSGGSLD